MNFSLHMMTDMLMYVHHHHFLNTENLVTGVG